MSDHSSIGHWLRSARKAKGLTQEELANGSGLTRPYIGSLERGKIALPQQRTREKLHHVLGTTDDELEDLGLLARDEFGAEYAPTAERRKEADKTPRRGLVIPPVGPDEMPDAEERREDLARLLGSFHLTERRFDALSTIMTSFAVGDRTFEDDIE